MSGTGFHVHGPHDHELEHAAQHGSADGFAGKVAVMTAILATIGALFGYMGGLTMADAGLFKNNAAIKKTAAADQWNYYQAKSTKQSLAELAMDLATTDDQRAKYKDKIAKYDKDKAEVKAEADKLEAESTEWDEKSEHQLHEHHRWAQATTALQIAIAMAAIALLTRRKWLEYGVFGLSALGVVVGALAYLHI